MSLRSHIGKLARSILRSNGYELTKRDVMRFGIDPARDVRLLANRTGKKIKICFDVGANEGQSAISMLSEFPEARIYSFEPVDVTYEKLKNRTAGEPRIFIHNMALSNESKKGEIYTYDSSLLASLNPSAPYATQSGFTSKPQICAVQTLDTFCVENSIEKIDFLKVDTEANDLNVLLGGKHMLGSGISFLSVELNALNRNDNIPNLHSFNEFLEPLGYRCIATYVDEIHVDMDFLLVANAMFVHVESLRRRSSIN